MVNELTAPKMIKKLDAYFKAIDAVREKQLREIHETRNQQNELNQIKVWNNVLALTYIRHRCDLLKQALELLSDSRNHLWLEIRKKNSKNHYEPIVTEILSGFVSENITKSLDDVCSKMVSEDFSKKINRIKWDLYFAQAQIFLLILTALLICFTIFIGGMMLGQLIQSFDLYMGTVLVSIIIMPLGIILLSLLEPSPLSFKNNIAEKFIFLEKELKTERESENFLAEKFNISIKLSEAEDNVSEQLLIVNPPSNFVRQKPRSELSSIFNNNLLLFSDSSSNTITACTTLKAAVEEEYYILLNNP